MTIGQKSPAAGWAKYVVLASQGTVVLGSVLAVGLVMRLHSDTALNTSSGIALASAEAGPQIANGAADREGRVGPEKPSGSNLKRPAALLEGSPGPTLSKPVTESNGRDQVPGSASVLSNVMGPAGNGMTDQPLSESKPAQDAAAAIEAAQDVRPEAARPIEAQAGSSNGPLEIDHSMKPAGANEVDTDVTAAIKADPAAGAPAKEAHDRSSLSTTRSEPREKSTKRQDKAASPQAKQQDTDAQPTRARGPQPSAGKPQMAKADVKTEQKRPMPAAAQRSRTALAQTDGVPAPSGQSATAQPAPTDERVRLLGIPLPTGSEIKQCLLEFRC